MSHIFISSSSLPSPPYSPSATSLILSDDTQRATRRQSSISYVSSRVDVYSRHHASTHSAPPDTRTDARGITSRSNKRRTIAGLESLTTPIESPLEAFPPLLPGSDTRRPPTSPAALTLADKHADLLHAIAAAESRRLELKGQLAAVEGELGELQSNWERIINRDPHHHHSPTVSNTHTPASVVDGFKEGVRLIAAGLSDLSDFSSHVPAPSPPIKPQDKPSISKRHAQHESDSSTSVSTTSGRGQLSSSSISSVCDRDRCLSSPIVEKTAGVSHPPFGLAQHEGPATTRQEKLVRRRSRDVSHPPRVTLRDSTSTSSSVDFESVPPTVRGASIPAMGTVSTTRIASPKIASKRSSEAIFPPPSSIPGAGSLTVVGEAWGNVGKKFGGDVFSKSQKRASVLFADVSQSIVSALSPGPVATSPSPFPSMYVSPSQSSLCTPSSPSTTSPSLSSLSPSTSAYRNEYTDKITNTNTRTRTPPASLCANVNVPQRPISMILPRKGSWLEDDDEEEEEMTKVGVRAGSVMMPCVMKPKCVVPAATKSFNGGGDGDDDDDDDWNW